MTRRNIQISPQLAKLKRQLTNAQVIALKENIQSGLSDDDAFAKMLVGCGHCTLEQINEARGLPVE